MGGDIDALAAMEGDRRQVLVEEGLEDDDFVAGLDERREGCVLAWKNGKGLTYTCEYGIRGHESGE